MEHHTFIHLALPSDSLKKVGANTLAYSVTAKGTLYKIVTLWRREKYIFLDYVNIRRIVNQAFPSIKNIPGLYYKTFYCIN